MTLIKNIRKCIRFVMQILSFILLFKGISVSILRLIGQSWRMYIKKKCQLNSLSSQCARGKSSIARKPEDQPIIFKW